MPGASQNSSGNLRPLVDEPHRDVQRDLLHQSGAIAHSVALLYTLLTTKFRAP